jgi:arabinofuranosyltransferase
MLRGRWNARVWITLALLAAGAAGVWAHARAYGRFVTDDAFISLRYTQRLIEGKGLTWTGTEHVEGYSNLLWVLLCAVPGLLGADLVDGARALGMLCTVATFGAIVALARPANAREALAPLLAIALLCATDSIAVWSMAGLEPPLVCALLGWGVVAATRAADAPRSRWTLLAAACFGLLCVSRPDGGLWGAVAAPTLVFARGRTAIRPAAAILVGTAACVLAQLAFRLAYYQDYFPNTAYAKVVLSDRRLEAGLTHVQDSLLALGAGWLALSVSSAQGLARRSLRAQTWLLLVPAIVWVAYVARVGGDNFPAWRHFPYVLVLAALLLVGVLAEDLRRGAASDVARWGLSLVVFAGFCSHFDQGNWAKQEVWQWDGAPVGTMLGRGFAREQPLVAVDAAGSIPFFSRLPALDMLGLTDRYLAHHRPSKMGGSLIGHELGDAGYYLRRKPDIVCFGVPPCARPAKFGPQIDMVRRREFRDQYSLVRFEARGGRHPLVSELWVRRTGPIGIHSESASVHVPGYFFNGDSVIVRLDGDRFFAQLPPRTTSSLGDVRLRAGAWVLTVATRRGGGTVSVSAGGEVLGATSTSERLGFSLDSGGAVQITLEPGPDGLSLWDVQLEPAPA